MPAGAAVGVGGIMGGATAEISGRTTTVLLETANFDPGAIAATGKRLGLHSEARARFERGVDIELPARAIDRFVELLGPEVRRGPTTDVRAPSSAPRPGHAAHRHGPTWCWARRCPRPHCAELIAPLGFGAVPAGATALPGERCRPGGPTAEREIDLIEEVARIYGYDNIDRTLPQRPIGAGGLTRYQRARRRVRRAAGRYRCQRGVDDNFPFGWPTWSAPA